MHMWNSDVYAFFQLFCPIRLFKFDVTSAVMQWLSTILAELFNAFFFFCIYLTTISIR